MSFVSGIPASGQSLGSSKPSVEGNFSYINTTNSVNHVAFNEAGAGKHKFLQMPEQASSPGTSINEMALFTKEVSGISEIFLQRENLAAAGVAIQMSSGDPKQGSTANFGQSFLPGGFQIKWGNETLASTSGNVVSYTVKSLDNFPTNTVAVFVVATGTDTSQSAQPSAFSSTGFTVTCSKTSLNVSWVAIGY